MVLLKFLKILQELQKKTYILKMPLMIHNIKLDLHLIILNKTFSQKKVKNKKLKYLMVIYHYHYLFEKSPKNINNLNEKNPKNMNKLKAFLHHHLHLSFL